MNSQRERNPSEAFAQEYFGAFDSNPHEKFLQQLAKEYHDRAESYDQTICTRTSMVGHAMPADRRQAELINKNAKALFEELAKKSNGDRLGLLKAIRNNR